MLLRFALAMLLWGLVGCQIQMPQEKWSSSVSLVCKDEYRVEKDHLCLVARELSLAEQEKYFKMEFADASLQVVNLAVENQTSEEVLFTRQKIVGMTQAGEKLAPLNPRQVQMQVSYSHWRVAPYYVLFLPGVFFVSLQHEQIEEANRSLQEQIAASIWSKSSLAEGEKFSSLLWFATEEKMDHLLVTVGRSEGEESFLVPVLSDDTP